MTLSAGTTLGHYEIRARLGGGGMGEVYRAFDARLRRDVAIKQVAPGNARADEALHEARNASALSHPNICTIHEVVDHERGAFIVMELVDGRTLADLLPPGGFPTQMAVGYGLQVASAMAHAHARGIVHRDLKGANVQVTPDGLVKVLDFGLARRLDAGQLQATTRSQEPLSMAGTLAYMAPELLRGHPADTRSDIWALGVMLYELATGRLPFAGATGYEMSAAILDGPLPPMHAVPPPLATVIARCLVRDPAGRWPTAAELHGAFETVRAMGGAEAPPARMPGRRRVALATASAVLVAAVVGFTMFRGTAPAPAADVRALAVLPFTDLSGDQPYLADGMTDALITDLSKVPSLRVIARTSMMRYRAAPRPLAELARELDVDAIIDGTVQQAGGRVQVTAALIDPGTQQQRWSERYERNASDVLSLQREIAQAIAGELRGRLSSAQAPAQVRSVHPAAQEAYLRGRYHWNRRSEAELKRALDYFNQAVAADPSFADAYAGLADTYAVLGFYVWLPPAEAFPRAIAAAQRALALDAGHGGAHATLAYARLYYEWDFPAAEAGFRRALELNDGSAVAHQWYANYLTAAGRWDDALAEMSRARQLDPLSSIASAATGWIHWYARQTAAMEQSLRSTINLDDRFMLAHLWLAWAYGETGRLAEARRAAEVAVTLSNRSPSAVATLARIAGQSGAVSEARRLVAEIEKPDQAVYVPRHDLAVAYVALGEQSRALDLLDEAYSQRENQLVFIRWEPRLDPLRAHPRFRALVERMGFPGAP